MKLKFHCVNEQPELEGNVMAYAETSIEGLLWGAVIGRVRDFCFTGEAAENVLPGEY